VEHAFGALKGWFQSLRELQLPVHSEKDLQYAVNWVICCLVLHNMIIQFEERLYGEKSPQRKESETWARNEVPHVEAENEPVVADMNDGSPGQAFRQRLMNLILNSPHQPRAIQRDK
ncbi:hypothetical protein PAXRUDRAFT_175107, partial [Paxillus rubicundulus Ve08.2h10]